MRKIVSLGRSRGFFCTGLLVMKLPGEKGSYNPGEKADENGTRFGADIASLQGFADGIIPLERYCKDGQDACMCHGQFDKGNRLT